MGVVAARSPAARAVRRPPPPPTRACAGCRRGRGARRGAHARAAAAAAARRDDTAALARAKRVYDAAFGELDRERCMRIAEASTARRMEDDEWFYGELDFSFFAALLSNLSPDPAAQGTERFVDLGSGAGKAVACAALTQNFQSVVGVELLPELYEASVSAKADVVRLAGSAGIGLPAEYDLAYGNMLQYPDLSSADVVYCHATCLEQSTVQALAWNLEYHLKPGGRVVLMSKQLSPADAPSFAPYGPGVIPAPQGHAAEARLACFLYVKRRG